MGISISDESETFAQPLVVLQNNEELLSELETLCKDNNVEGIVVGDSKDYKMMENEIMKEITPFTKILEERLKLPVYMHPEFLTSKQAEHIQGKNEMHDASAAAIILGSFLETKNNKK